MEQPASAAGSASGSAPGRESPTARRAEPEEEDDNTDSQDEGGEDEDEDQSGESGDDGSSDADADGPPGNRKLDAAFGAQGSWALSGAVPPSSFWLRATENPYHIREWRSIPKLSKKETQALLSRWGAAAINSKGLKGGNHTYCVGQDNFCVALLASGWEVFGVFDGHGSVGHWPSARLARTVPYLLQGPNCESLLAGGFVEEALRFAIKAAQADLEDRAKKEMVNVRTSGSTLVVAMRRPGQDCIWVATVGDSRAALLRPAGGPPGGGPSDDDDDFGGAVVVQETVDHKPFRKEERDRIHGSGGRVVELKYPDGQCDYRVYFKDVDRPGIALSRSMGDTEVKAVGVSAEPDVVRWELTGLDDAYLLLCSDGVWEFLSTQEVADKVMSGLHNDDAQQALHSLLEDCKAEWLRRGGTYVDDITMVLVPLKGEQAPRWDEVHDPVATSEGFLSFLTRGRTSATLASNSSASDGGFASDGSERKKSSRLLRPRRTITSMSSDNPCTECSLQ